MASTVVVVASNGVYACVYGPSLSAENALSKAIQLCQKKGGINPKVLATASGTGGHYAFSSLGDVGWSKLKRAMCLV